LSFKLSLLEDACKRFRMYIIVQMSRNGYPPQFFWVLILSVTPLGANQIPSISLQPLDEFSDFHEYAAALSQIFSPAFYHSPQEIAFGMENLKALGPLLFRTGTIFCKGIKCVF